MAPVREPSEEIVASKVPLADERSTENITFTDDEMGALYPFLGGVMSTPEVVFDSTAPDLPRQVHELIGDHVDILFHDRLTLHGSDSDVP